MDETNRSRLEALGDQSVVEAGEFMGVDAIGHPVTHPRLNMTLVAAQFPITASWLPWIPASGRGGKELIDQNIKRGVSGDGGSTKVVNLQAGEG